MTSVPKVVEYSVSGQSEVRRHPVTSGPAWCLAIGGERRDCAWCNSPSADCEARTLAVGTEEGFVCLFSLTKEGLEYARVFDRQEGRILCLAW